MREYAKVGPTFWTGSTGKALRRRGIEGVLVALYLVSSPHSNMLGLYYQPLMYMAHETGLGIEGASKGLQSCIEVGFCSYDPDTEMVWVHEMAAWQIAESLSSSDKRCRGIQKDYEAVPDCPFVGPWFDRYRQAYHLTNRREFQEPQPTQKQAPSKPLRSQEQEQEQEQEQDPLAGEGAEGPSKRGKRLPADWALPAPWGNWALAEFPHWTPEIVRRLAQQFRDHWTAKTGKGATKLDWPATWRNWCSGDIAQRQFPPPKANGTHHSGQPPLDELTAGVQRRLGITTTPPSTQEVIDA